MVALDVTGPLDVFHCANELLSRYERKREGYDLTFSALEPGPVPTSSGLRLHADRLPSMQETNILLVPGGLAAEAVSREPAVVQAVRLAAQRAQRIVSVCSGAFLLAASGLLEGRRATTHWMVTERLAELYPETCVEADAIFVVDGNIATSAGVTAGIDLALAWWRTTLARNWPSKLPASCSFTAGAPAIRVSSVVPWLCRPRPVSGLPIFSLGLKTIWGRT